MSRIFSFLVDHSCKCKRSPGENHIRRTFAFTGLPLKMRLIYGLARRAAISCTVIHVAPVEAGRGNLREDPAGQAAWRETAFKNDLILHLARDERTHNLIHRPDP